MEKLSSINEKRIEQGNEDDEKEFEMAIRKAYETNSFEDNLKARLGYYWRYIQYLYAIDNEEDEELKKQLGYGFVIAEMDYQGNDLIKEYMAKQFILEIVNDHPEYFDYQGLYSRFKTKEALEKKGIRKYMLDVISMYDANLANYLKCNIKLLDDQVASIRKKIGKLVYYEEQLTSNVSEIINEFYIWNPDYYYSPYEIEKFLKFKYGCGIPNDYEENEIMNEQVAMEEYDNLDLEAHKLLKGLYAMMQEYEKTGELPTAYTHDFSVEGIIKYGASKSPRKRAKKIQ